VQIAFATLTCRTDPVQQWGRRRRFRQRHFVSAFASLSETLLASVASPNRADELLGDAESEYHKMIVRLFPGPCTLAVSGIRRAGDHRHPCPGVLARTFLLFKLLGRFRLLG
jgi:hypothetical protein